MALPPWGPTATALATGSALGSFTAVQGEKRGWARGGGRGRRRGTRGPPAALCTSVWAEPLGKAPAWPCIAGGALKGNALRAFDKDKSNARHTCLGAKLTANREEERAPRQTRHRGAVPDATGGRGSRNGGLSPKGLPNHMWEPMGLSHGIVPPEITFAFGSPLFCIFDGIRTREVPKGRVKSAL